MSKTVIVVGLGSMGRRRIRLLKQAYPKIIIGGVDSQQARLDEAEKQFSIPVFTDINKAVDTIKPVAGFVCTSPLSHYAVIMKLLSHRLHVFTELNLVDDGYDEMMALAKNQKCELFLSSTMLYRKDIQYIIERVKDKKVNYTVHIGQYLPDWHPWESYKDFFVGNVRTNGCREHMAIDFPWVLSAFGEVESFSVMRDKSSSLEIDYEDNYFIMCQHKNGNKGIFITELISRKGGRNVKVFSEDMHITWAGTPDSLYDYDIENKVDRRIETYNEALVRQKDYNACIIENAYLDEIKTFFGVIGQQFKALYTFEDDKKTIALINEIEGRS